MVSKKLTVADFFCGAGGFSEGFRQKGFDVVFSLDNWAPAKKTHDLNHPDCQCELMDILELDTIEKIENIVPDTDIIVGSPPCVSFSGSNKAGKADKSLGIRLIKAYLRIIAVKLKKGTCKYWILENVPNSGKYIQDSYTWEELGLPGGKKIAIEIPVKGILNAAEYGAPQTRKRFVCGNYPEPYKSHEDKKSWITMRNVQKALSNPLDITHPSKIKDPVYGFELDSKNLTDHFYDTSVADYEWMRSKRLKEDHGFMGKMSFPEYLDRPSRTVMATMSASTRESIIFEAIKSNKQTGYRLPTIREIACFMSFPITYQFEGANENTKYKLIGNAVCCKLSSALAEAIAKAERTKIQEYIPQKIIKSSFDLTGIKRSPKVPKPRAKDARFAIPIPYLKIKSFRVELSNTDSEFSKGKYVWKSKVHYGSGKSAKVAILDLKKLDKVLFSNKNFSTFKKDLENSFKDFKLSARELQESYVLNGKSKVVSPDKALELIRKLITKHYTNQEAVSIENKFIEIERAEIPLLTIIGAYACGYFVSLIKN
jgi:DNA (cytosine-5)-methyltransferase 1